MQRNRSVSPNIQRQQIQNVMSKQEFDDISHFQIPNTQSEMQQDIKEKVKIFVRIRPTLSTEIPEDFIFQEEDNTILVDRPGNPIYMKFNNILGQQANQENVYEQVKDSVSYFLMGNNQTIFAYGQTGAGKTYTILGDQHLIENVNYTTQQQFSSDQQGILPRALAEVMDSVSQMNQDSYKMLISFYEVYNEKIYDLFDINSTEKEMNPLEIRENKNGDVQIQGLVQISVNNLQQALNILSMGLKKRAIGSTMANAQSSRSHSIFQINLQQKIDSTNIQESLLRIVDLAGSEKCKIPMNISQEERELRIEELTCINGSLSNLGQCIQALTNRKRTHIPLRNSKLTRVLSDSLSGTSRITFLVCISPSISSSSETFSTLQFANRAKKAVLDGRHLRIFQQRQDNHLQDDIQKLLQEYQKEKSKRIQYENILKEGNTDVTQLQLQIVELRQENDELKSQLNFHKSKVRQQQSLLSNHSAQNLDMYNSLNTINNNNDISQNSNIKSNQKNKQYNSNLQINLQNNQQDGNNNLSPQFCQQNSNFKNSEFSYREIHGTNSNSKRNSNMLNNVNSQQSIQNMKNNSNFDQNSQSPLRKNQYKQVKNNNKSPKLQGSPLQKQKSMLSDFQISPKTEYSQPQQNSFFAANQKQQQQQQQQQQIQFQQQLSQNNNKKNLNLDLQQLQKQFQNQQNNQNIKSKEGLQNINSAKYSEDGDLQLTERLKKEIGEGGFKNYKQEQNNIDQSIRQNLEDFWKIQHNQFKNIQKTDEQLTNKLNTQASKNNLQKTKDIEDKLNKFLDNNSSDEEDQEKDSKQQLQNNNLSNQSNSNQPPQTFDGIQDLIYQQYGVNIGSSLNISDITSSSNSYINNSNINNSNLNNSNINNSKNNIAKHNNQNQQQTLQKQQSQNQNKNQTNLNSQQNNSNQKQVINDKQAQQNLNMINNVFNKIQSSSKANQKQVEINQHNILNNPFKKQQNSFTNPQESYNNNDNNNIETNNDFQNISGISSVSNNTKINQNNKFNNNIKNTPQQQNQYYDDISLISIKEDLEILRGNSQESQSQNGQSNNTDQKLPVIKENTSQFLNNNKQNNDQQKKNLQKQNINSNNNSKNSNSPEKQYKFYNPSNLNKNLFDLPSLGGSNLTKDLKQEMNDAISQLQKFQEEDSQISMNT